MINRYTLVGQPVAHSISPAIHHLFGELTQRRLLYTRTEATESNFNSIIKQWFEGGGKGCNITTPFKELATTACDRLKESARLANAVNTIELHRDGALVGHNTDGIGLLTDIEKNKRVEITGKRILLLGAGGAARGAVAPILSAQPECLHIANRTVERAKLIADTFSSVGATHFSNYDDLTEEPRFDVVINATSMGFEGSAPPIPANVIDAKTFAYDMTYSKQQTPFLNWCEQAGVKHFSDGFGMLVEQAADAYLIWEGVRPKTRKVFLATDEIINSTAGISFKK